ncbi:MAG: 16S rRNA (guanine(966)-N(2))-methyltransferase RsmD [Candidatus Omnitrophota bacterium]
MKIIAGKYKGRPFKMPKGIRPTQDVHRKALFDILKDVIVGARFLDLFAGSGAVGLEAYSRAAAQVILVENNPQCLKVIRENLKGLGIGERSVKVLAADSLSAIHFLHRQGQVFDIIFLDPPYLTNALAKKTLQTLSRCDILSPVGFLICQHSKQEVLPEGEGNLTRFRQKKDGDTVFSFFRRL